MKEGDEIVPVPDLEKWEGYLTLKPPKRRLQIYLDDVVWLVDKAIRNDKASPPSSALLSALLPSSISEDVIENLNEIFHVKWVARHGARTARRIWRVQAVLIIVQHWLSPIGALLDRIKQLKIGH